MVTTLKKGLDVPVTGAPEARVDTARTAKTVALLGRDYIGMKPTMAVAEGDTVKAGQVLFTDKKTHGVQFTSPAAGTVLEVNRGPKRRFDSMVIQVDGDAAESFPSESANKLATLGRETVRERLVASGLWTAFRTRPFTRVPATNSDPRSIFVTAMDTNPLAADPATLIDSAKDDFVNGLKVLAQVADGPVYLCKAAGASIPGGDVESVKVEEFGGPHPAGLPGTHIHFLDPVGMAKSVWHIGYQDVIAIGRLFTTGKLDTTRIISLAGPGVTSPRLLRTRLGACTYDLVEGELKDGDHRVVSGSILSGHTAAGADRFLGRYHNQVSVLREGTERELLGWHLPGFDKFSFRKVFAAAWTKGSKDRKFDLTTSTGGSRRAMVPIGMYEDIMPLDIQPTFLLRSLIVKDLEQSQALGALELDEEDLALCTFVCPGKYDYAPILRETLAQIEKEG